METHFPLERRNWAENLQAINVKNIQNISYAGNFVINLQEHMYDLVKENDKCHLSMTHRLIHISLTPLHLINFDIQNCETTLSRAR